MSTLASEALGSSPVGDITSSSSTLLPTVTRIDARTDVNPVSVVLAVSIVFILAPITISGNTMILAAFYRYKRLRTASNCLLASLAISDFGVGIFMPFGMHLELSGLPDKAEVSNLCIAPYCIVIALCSVSILVTVAIAVDRLTSLAQPLRYKNIITHSSIEKYIAAFWLYAIVVGLSPLIYAHIMGLTEPHSGSCRFGVAVQPPVRVFLVVAVWAPSALVLLGCYMYVYLVARAHARAIYTVELSFRHQTQTLALPRYGQILAVTVGAFLILWLPFQACMLLDIFCGTKILSEWAVVWLGLPILAHSGANPWIYAFHHGEMRIAASKIAEDVITRFGIHPSRYGCSPSRRGSNTHLELAEVNKNNESRIPPIEDCFAAKNQSSFYPRDKIKCVGELASNNTDISPEGIDSPRRFSEASFAGEIVEEDIHDLTKMLKPEYAIDRNHVIDSNHNIDKIKNLKYLLDPTFNRIRHMRRVNHHKLNIPKTLTRFDEPKYISYQNLKSEEGGTNGKILRLNALSDPILKAQNSPGDNEDLGGIISVDRGTLCTRRNSNLSSMSDPNIKATTANGSTVLNKFVSTRSTVEDHSVQCRCHEKSGRNRTKQMIERQKLENTKRTNYSKSDKTFFRYDIDGIRRETNSRRETFTNDSSKSPRFKYSLKQMTLTTNKLANFFNPDNRKAQYRRESKNDDSTKSGHVGLNPDTLKHSETISVIERPNRARFLEPSRFMDSLTVPTIHSEPPSPINPLPLDSLKEEEPLNVFTETACRDTENIHDFVSHSPRNLARMSDPTIPFVLLNIEDCGSSFNGIDGPIDPFEEKRERSRDSFYSNQSAIAPEELAQALLVSSDISSDKRKSDTIFTEHDSTRFSSRRPSDLRWSEASRSQEIISNVNEHHKSPSSYSVNNFGSCTSVSDLNDPTCLDSFMCPDPLSSSLRESFFETPSVPDSDVFTSFEDLETRDQSLDLKRRSNASSWALPMVHSSVSSVNFQQARVNAVSENNQSKSTETVFNNRHSSIMRLEPSVHRSRLRVRPANCCMIKDSPFKRVSRLAPLATQTPMEICSPTCDTTAEIKGASGMGVRV